MVIKGNEADKAANRAMDMPGMTTTRLPYTGYYLTFRRVETPNGKGRGKIVIGNYTTSNHTLKSECAHNTSKQNEVKFTWLHIRHTTLTRGHLMTRNR